MQLTEGTLLQGGKYKIERVLGQGGFGITYLATQVLLGRKVCIKEFFFKQFCERDEGSSRVTLGTKSNRELVDKFMQKFVKEARTISQLDHSNIIRIHDIFEENGTAYYVMEYHSGGSLGDLVKDGAPLPETEAVKYITQIADAVGYIHEQRINHLDIKPGNILLDRKGCGVLIDFGLSKQYDESGDQTSSTPVGISHGYAPMEQYKQKGVATFSPQSDIYSLGATLFKLVTGVTPPQAMDIFNDGLPALPAHLSDGVKKAIEQAMKLHKNDRPATAEEFVALLSGGSASAEPSNDEVTKIIAQPEDILVATPEVEPIEPIEKPAPKPVAPEKKEPETPKPVEKKKKEKSLWLWVTAVVVASILGVLVWQSTVVKTPEEAYNIGCDYYFGTNGKQTDYSEAVEWFRKAAEQGYARAQYDLGYCYDNGQGVPQDYSEAVKWYRKAAEQGHAGAENNLGVCYENGQGVSQNYSEAVKWYRKAAEQGNKYAQNNLGLCYGNGWGVPQDYSEAVKWYRKAAEQGYAGALNNLGYENCRERTIDDLDIKVKERNKMVITVNMNNQIIVKMGRNEPKKVQISEIRQLAKEFIKNPNNDGDLPELHAVELPAPFGVQNITKNHVISFVTDRAITDDLYFHIENELYGAYNELRDELAKRTFGFGYNLCNSGQQLAVCLYYKCNIFLTKKQYDWIYDFIEGLAVVCLNGKYGFVNKSAEIVIPLKYNYATCFSEGLACVELNGKWGFINKSGNFIIPYKYDNACKFFEGLAKVELNGKYGFIDKSGNVVIQLKYDYVSRFIEGRVWVELNGEGFCIDKQGNRVD